MGAVTKTTALALADAIAAHIVAVQTLVGGSTAAIITGEATTLARIAALNDAAQQYALLDGFTAAMQSEAAYLTALSNYNAILDLYRAACNTIDGSVVGGLAAFLAANQPATVAPVFFDAFNRAMIGYGKSANALQAWLAFGAVLSNMAQTTVTGATTGTFLAGTPQALYGNAPLSIKNVGAAVTGASASVFTVTYNTYNASGVLLTAQTATATMPAASAIGATVALSGSASGVQVTGISQTLGNVGDVIAVVSTNVRTPAF